MREEQENETVYKGRRAKMVEGRNCSELALRKRSRGCHITSKPFHAEENLGAVEETQAMTLLSVEGEQQGDISSKLRREMFRLCVGMRTNLFTNSCQLAYSPGDFIPCQLAHKTNCKDHEQDK